MLDHLINNQDQDRSFVPFKDEDEVVLLLNNLGGMSCLEMGAMLGDVLECLGKPPSAALRKLHQEDSEMPI